MPRNQSGMASTSMRDALHAWSTCSRRRGTFAASGRRAWGDGREEGETENGKGGRGDKVEKGLSSRPSSGPAERPDPQIPQFHRLLSSACPLAALFLSSTLSISTVLYPLVVIPP
ncbi:hypothetical protein VTJ04DRAFT_9216 [Mycothermus thermophilus]|uniref:uncharacterized protein n=1 Tax=Humicola insolens TaxID=85995 RepID=UPI003743B615